MAALRVALAAGTRKARVPPSAAVVAMAAVALAAGTRNAQVPPSAAVVAMPRW
jgi:hypothetical protein